MGFAKDSGELERWEDDLIALGLRLLGGDKAPFYPLDLIMIGALKRTLSLRSALAPMIASKNMLVARALLRMHLDTVARLLAYTYVSSPHKIASAVIGGKQLRKFKALDGQALTDTYLVQRLSKDHPWVERVYKTTSGYVHFSERQFVDSVESIEEGHPGMLHLQIGKGDDKYPEFSWGEVVGCFNHLTRLLADAIESYASTKPASLQRTDATGAGRPR
jgi:hypothetical protein